jgi:oligogalacturonide lyase
LVTIAVLSVRAQELPREWIDPDTGHRVVRLSDEPGSASLYFHQNAYTPDGEKLIVTTPSGLSTINLKTRAIEKVVDGRVSVIITGKKTGDYYTKSGKLKPLLHQTSNRKTPWSAVTRHLFVLARRALHSRVPL